MSQLQQPVMYFNDLDGSPLDNGSLYFGTVNLNPETSPIVVYWDSALTQIAAQPVKTSNGRPVRNGTIAALFAGSDFSLTVKNKSSSLVYYAPKSADVYSAFTQSLLAAPDAATARTVLGAVAKIGDTMSGDLVLNNTTTDTPNIKFTDPVNNTSAYWDEKLERVRLMTSYRGGAETERIGVDANTGEIAINGSAGAIGSVLLSNGSGAGAAWGNVSTMGFSNRLINGDFQVDYIAEFAQNYGTVLQYAINRWYVVAGSSVSVTRSIVSGYRVISVSGNVASTTLQVGQRIHSSLTKDLVGASVTLRGNVSTTGAGVTYAIYAPTTTENGFGSLASPTQVLLASGTFSDGVTVALPSDSRILNGLTVEFVCATFAVGNTLSLSRVAITKSGQSPDDGRPYHLEKSLCYAFAPVWNENSAGSNPFGCGSFDSATSAKILLPFMSQVNASPTGVIVAGAGNFGLSDGVTTVNTAPGNVTLFTGGTSGVMLNVGGLSGRTQYRFCFAIGPSGGAGPIAILGTGCEL